MSVVAHIPGPGLRRLSVVLWFPFAMAIIASLVFMGAYHKPVAHDLRIDVSVSGTSTLTAATVSDTLGAATPGGFTVHATSTEGARQDVRDRTAAGALVVTNDGAVVDVAQAASSTAATLVQQTLTAVVQKADAGTSVTVRNLVPVEAGDSGVALFYYVLPLNLVGLVMAVLLLQLPMLTIRQRLLAHTVGAVFTSVVAFGVARAFDIIPGDPLMLIYGLVLPLIIGWLISGLAPFVKQQILAVAMTFAVLIGVPSSGGAIPGPLLPSFFRFFNDFMPFAQLVDAGRSVFYFHEEGLLRPTLVLLAWLVVAAGVLSIGERHHRRAVVRTAAEAADVERELGQPNSDAGTHEITGRIRTNKDEPLHGAVVTLLDDNGTHLAQAATDVDGRFLLRNVTAGLHHLLVTARGYEAITETIPVHPARDVRPVDITLVAWNDAASNLTASDLDL